MSRRYKTRRQYCRPIIARVLMAYRNFPEKIIRRALREAYPFGARAHHPYKIWLDEIRVQRGLRRFGKRYRKPDKNQLQIFNN